MAATSHIPLDAGVRRRVLAVLAGVGVFVSASCAWGEDVPEYRLKAAFLYNFAVFTEWPGPSSGALNLCIYGADPFGAEIDPLNGKKVAERSVAVQRKASVESLKACQMVFIPSASAGQLPRVLETLRGLPVLTVAESPGAVRQGAALNLTLTQGRVTFEANLEAARAAQLKLSANMLRLATEVVR